MEDSFTTAVLFALPFNMVHSKLTDVLVTKHHNRWKLDAFGITKPTNGHSYVHIHVTQFVTSAILFWRTKHPWLEIYR